MGVARESITAVMPLFLFREHWAVAKRKMPPIFGMMCTLDIMGYQSSQLFTVPFLVLAKILQKVKADPNEYNKRMLKFIEETCYKILESYPKTRAEVGHQIVNFCYQKEKTSSRTVDVVPSIEVLLYQFYSMLKLPDLKK